MFIHVHRNKGMGHIIQAAGWLYAFKVLTVIGESYTVDLRCYHPSLCTPLPAVMTAVEIMLINAC